MKKQTYYLSLILILVAMVLALGLGMTTGNVVVPVIIIVCAAGAIWVCHRQVTDVMTDDLEGIISGKAAVKALEVTVIVAAIGFAVAMGFYFGSGGWGTGMHVFNNGSVLVGATQYYPTGHVIYDGSYLIADPANLTMDDLTALDRLSVDSHRTRDLPFAYGIALGSVVVLLGCLYAAFSYYYTKKYEV